MEEPLATISLALYPDNFCAVRVAAVFSSTTVSVSDETAVFTLIEGIWTVL